MRTAILFITTSPTVYNKLMAELLSAEASRKISRPIKYQAQALPYLQAVIRESMRIHLAVGVPLPRVVPAGGATLGGFFLPEGTWVGMAPWAVNHSKEVFGEDAHIFRPERRLENEEKNKYWEEIDVTFGSGYCVCLGKNIALMETYKTVVKVSSSSRTLCLDYALTCDFEIAIQEF
jgi:cytochrome P450